MKYFKKYTYLLMTLLGGIITACDDYVDIEPQGFDTPSQTNQLDLVLVNFDVALDPNSYLLSDDYNIPFGEQLAWFDNDGTQEVLLYQLNPEPLTSGETDTEWRNAYRSIGQMNFVLGFIDEAEGIEQERLRIKAEALTTRAFGYYHLANVYGQPYTQSGASASESGVPIVNGEFGDTEQSLQRATLEEVYNAIEADLNEAIDLFPNDLPSDNRRFSRSSAYSVLALAHFAQGEYDEALTASNEALALQNSLLDYNIDLEEITAFDFTCFCFAPTGKFKEPFANNNAELHIQRTSGRPGYFDATFQGINLQILSDDLAALFDQTNDLRYTRRTSDEFFENFTVLGRVLNDDSFDAGTRTSEIMLVQAESEARAGDFNAALDIVNNLRATRFDAAFVATGGHLLNASTREEAINLIIEERRRELMFKTSRLYDIRRLNSLHNAGISLTRVVGEGGVSESLLPDDPRWTKFLAPDLISNGRGELSQSPR